MEHTVLIELTQYPNEENASLRYGETEIRMSASFIHQLTAVLAKGREEGEWYSRDITELQLVLSRIRNEMSKASQKQTSEQLELLNKRHDKTGHGYWSSWMDEPCPW